MSMERDAGFLSGIAVGSVLSLVTFAFGVTVGAWDTNVFQ
jgi:tetrahydromethanopterin S-methyltransferase subunit G